MTLAILAGVAGALMAVAAAAFLWRGSIRHEPPVRNAYRWLAGVALLGGAGFVAEEGVADSRSRAPPPYWRLMPPPGLPPLGGRAVGLGRAVGGPEPHTARRGPP